MRCSVTIRCEMQTRRRELVTSSVREAEKVVFHVKKVSTKYSKKTRNSIWVTLSWMCVCVCIGSIRTKTATLYTELIAKKNQHITRKTHFLKTYFNLEPPAWQFDASSLESLSRFHSDKKTRSSLSCLQGPATGGSLWSARITLLRTMIGGSNQTE